MGKGKPMRSFGAELLAADLNVVVGVGDLMLSFDVDDLMVFLFELELFLICGVHPGLCKKLLYQFRARLARALYAL